MKLRIESGRDVLVCSPFFGHVAADRDYRADILNNEQMARVGSCFDFPHGAVLDSGCNYDVLNNDIAP